MTRAPREHVPRPSQRASAGDADAVAASTSTCRAREPTREVGDAPPPRRPMRRCGRGERESAARRARVSRTPDAPTPRGLPRFEYREQIGLRAPARRAPSPCRT